MRLQILKTFFLFLCLTSIHVSLSAQTKPEKKPEAKQVRIEMTDGNFVDGKLITRLGDTVVVESTTLGTLNLNIKNIKNIEELAAQNFKSGKYYWFENVHAISGFVMPTGFNLRKGEGYYANTFLFFQQAGYGFSDNFSISAGTEIISLFGGGELGSWPQFFYINPKFSFLADKNLTIGTGMFLFFAKDGFGSRTTTIPFPYAVGTFGNRDNNLSFGLGAGVANGTTGRLLTLSAQVRLTRGIGLMSENYFGGDFGVGSTGFRFMNSSIAFNVGLMYSIGNDDGGFGSDSPVFPFLGLSVPFGSKKK